MSEFFEPPAPPPGSEVDFRPPPHEDWLGPPRTAVPAVVPTERLIARAGEASVWLGCFWVYPTGVEFEVFVDGDDQWSDLDPFDDARFRSSKIGDPSPDRLLIGFEFANGARVTTAGDGPVWTRDSEEASPTLISRSRRGGGGHWQKKFWLWPIPPPGGLEFVSEWSAAGIALTRSNLDSAAIIDAASRAQTIFPLEESARE